MMGLRTPSRPLALAAFLMLIPLLSIGCGSSNRLATVEGKVTVDGAPANAGEVVFTTKEGQKVPAVIHPDGTYRALEVPPGSAKVSVTSPPRPPTPPPGVKGLENMPGMSGAAAKPVPIPRKYASADSSGLTTVITGGTNKYNVELTSR